MELEHDIIGSKHVVGVPRYTIDLDLPPKLRWNQVADSYYDHFPIVKRVIGEMLGSAVESVATKLFEWAGSLGWVAYSDELKAIAKKGDISVGMLILMQLVYEASAACTSVVIRDCEGVTHHIRTMDWGMDFLKPLTVEYDFIRSGKLLYSSASWAGYVGVFTGMKPGIFSCSVNFRVTSAGSFWDNIKKSVNAAWPCGFLLRHVFETADTMDDAVNFLSQAPLIAPTYFTIAGIGDNDSHLITRDRSSEVQRWSYNQKGIIVQANVDWFMNESDEDSFDVMNSYSRRELARKLLTKLINTKKPITNELLWKIMSEDPICNSITVYGCYMNPERGILQCRVPSGSGFIPCSRNYYSNDEQDKIVPVVGGSHVKTHPIVLKVCKNCDQSFNAFANEKGQCSHNKTWHSAFSDCSYLKCGVGLGPSNIGSQHWGCCYETQKDTLVCKISDFHQAIDEI